MKTPSIHKNKTIVLWLLAITLIGVLLRCWNLFQIPLMHDEFSALSRLQFNTFQDLISFGVKPDGHPAGVQVFLYYYVKFFGNNAVVLKIPFLIIGILTIPLAYAVGKKWFSAQTGLLVATCIAVMQFPIMYSQIIRPYAPGLFFSLLLVYFWTNFIQSKKINIANGIGFVLSATACFYIHYFSMLFAIIVLFTGLFVIGKNKYKAYFSLIFAIGLLYLPHLPIFYVQLKKGGLSWLNDPEAIFFINYIDYIFNYSFLFSGLVLLIVLYSIWNIPTEKKHNFRLIALLWFLALPFIGYFYSLWFKPLLQFSILIFSFPFFLIFLFSYAENIRTKLLSFFVVVLLIAGIYSLVFTRQYYNIFYNQPYDSFYHLSQNFLKDKNADNTLVFYNGIPNGLDYYIKKNKGNLNYIAFKNQFKDITAFKEYLNKAESNYIVCNNIPRAYYAEIKKEFPYLIQYNKGFLYEFYAHSKTPPVNGFINQKITEKTIQLNHKDKISYTIDSISNSTYDFIELDVTFNEKPNEDCFLIMEIVHKGKFLSWEKVSLAHSIADTANNTYGIFVSHRLTHSIKRDYQLKEAKLNIYLNGTCSNMSTSKGRLLVSEGNEYIYSLYERF